MTKKYCNNKANQYRKVLQSTGILLPWKHCLLFRFIHYITLVSD